MDNLKKAEEADVSAIVVIESFVNGCRDPTHWLSILPSQEVGNLSVMMVGVLPTQQTNQTEEAIAEQVASQWRSPARVAPIEAPR